MKRIIYIVLLWILVGTLAACRETAENQQPRMTEAVNWTEQGFRVEGDLEEKQSFWIKQFHLCNNDAPKAKDGEVLRQRLCLGVIKNEVYQLYLFSKENHAECCRYVLTKMSTGDPLQVQQTEVEIANLGWGIDVPVVLDAWISEADTVVLEVAGYGTNGQGVFTQAEHFFSFVQDNREIKRVDVLDYLKEQDLIPSGLMVGSRYFATSDLNGYFYLLPDRLGKSNKSILVLDTNGNEVKRVSFQNTAQLSIPFRTPEGEILFAVSQNDDYATSVSWFDSEIGEVKSLVSLPETKLDRFVGMHGNCIYYLEKNQLIRWDYATGTRTAVFDLINLGAFDRNSLTMLWDEQEVPFLFIQDSESQWLVELSDREVGEQARTECVMINGSAGRLKECIAAANRQNRNMHFEFRAVDTAQNSDEVSRILAELAAGNGPDILVLSRKDMADFASKGMLLSMEELLSQQEMEPIRNAAIQLGSVDGELWGLPVGIQMRSMLLPEDVLESNTWTLPEFIRILENKKLEPVLLDGTSLLHSSEITVRILMRYCLQDDFFIDWTNKKSHFQDEEIFRLIQLFGKRVTENCDPTEIDEFRYYRSFSIDTFGSISRDEEDISIDYEEQGYKLVGFPNSKGNGNYVLDCGMIVVNANTKHFSEVKAFLNTFLSQDIQEMVSTEGYLGIIKTENQEPNLLFDMCVPLPEENETLQTIFFEEIEGYFSGEKPLEDCLRVIDNRVQLYLDESF